LSEGKRRGRQYKQNSTRENRSVVSRNHFLNLLGPELWGANYNAARADEGALRGEFTTFYKGFRSPTVREGNPRNAFRCQRSRRNHVTLKANP
jgi:hypothetical protein